MFDFLKPGKPQDIKGIRSAILQFIKEHLQKAEGGEGRHMKGLCLYISCTDEDRHLYEAAVFADEPERIQLEEVQRIADDYAISLPENWTLEMEFVEEIPEEAIRAGNVEVGLYIVTKKNQGVLKDLSACINVLNGEAEQPYYILTSGMTRMNIGREAKTQTSDGYFRENHIAFPDSSTHAANRSVSRQHAHIEWNNEAAAFYLFADEGGIPPMNKIKVRTAEGQQIKLMTTEIGHRLQEGDQVIIGEAALIEYTQTLPAVAH